MQTFTPAVITSKKADKHFFDIKSQYDDIVAGMQNQSAKLLQQKKEADAQKVQQMTLDSQNKQNERLNKAQEQKNIMDYSLKQKELDIKKRALEMA